MALDPGADSIDRANDTGDCDGRLKAVGVDLQLYCLWPRPEVLNGTYLSYRR